MPSHDTDHVAHPAQPNRRAHLLAGAGLLLAGLPMISGMATAAPAFALPAPPRGAEAVDWDHFGEPSLSAARRANVAASRALQATDAAPTVETRLYRLPGDVGWEPLLDHYQQSAAPRWRPEGAAGRVDTASPARQQRFAAADHAGQRFAVVWLPPAGEVRDGLLMVLRTVPAR